MNTTSRWARRGRKAAKVGQQIGWWCWLISAPLRAAMLIGMSIIMGLFIAACGLSIITSIFHGGTP